MTLILGFRFYIIIVLEWMILKGCAVLWDRKSVNLSMKYNLLKTFIRLVTGRNSESKQLAKISFFFNSDKFLKPVIEHLFDDCYWALSPKTAQ